MTIPKWTWSGLCDPVLHFGTQAISLERIKLDILNLFCILNVKRRPILPLHVLKFCSMGVHSGSRYVIKVWEITANISETVQDRNILQWKANRKSHVSHRTAPISNYLEWPWMSLWLFETFLTPINQWIWHVLTTLYVYMNGKVSVVSKAQLFSENERLSNLAHPLPYRQSL